MRKACLVLLLALSCQPKSDARFNRLRVALSGPFEPVSPTSWSMTSVAQNWVFEPLVKLAPDGSLIPSAASSLQRLDNGHFRVWLRQGITFSDGAPLTRRDLEESFSSVGLRIQEEANGYLVSGFAQTPVEPLLIRVLLFHHSREGKVVGGGPFVIVEENADHVVLMRRQHKEGFVDEVDLLRFSSPKDAVVHTLKGDADLLTQFEPRWRELFEGVPRFRIVKAPAIQTDSLVFGPRVSLADRLALARLLGSDALASAVYGPECAPSGLARAELSRGRKLSILAVPLYNRLAIAARRALGERAGPITITHDLPEFASIVRQGLFDLAVATPLTWPPSALALSWHSKSPLNFQHYSNPEADAAMDAGDWPRAKEALARSPPAAMVCTRQRFVVVDARIKNPVLGNYDLLETLPEWEMSE